MGERMEAYLAHAEENGNVGLQMQSKIGDHYEEIINTRSGSKIENLDGKVTIRRNPVQSKEKFFVVHD